MKINNPMFGFFLVILAVDARAQPETWTTRFWKNKLVVEHVADNIKVRQKVVDLYEVSSRDCEIECLKDHLEKSGIPSFLQAGALSWVSGEKTFTIFMRSGAEYSDGYMISSVRRVAGEVDRSWLGVDEKKVILDVESGSGKAVSRTILVKAAGPFDLRAIVGRLIAKGYLKRYANPDAFYVVDRGGEEVVLQSLNNQGQWSVLVVKTKESG